MCTLFVKLVAGSSIGQAGAAIKPAAPEKSAKSRMMKISGPGPTGAAAGSNLFKLLSKLQFANQQKENNRIE